MNKNSQTIFFVFHTINNIIRNFIAVRSSFDFNTIALSHTWFLSAVNVIASNNIVVKLTSVIIATYQVNIFLKK